MIVTVRLPLEGLSGDEVRSVWNTMQDVNAGVWTDTETQMTAMLEGNTIVSRCELPDLSFASKGMIEALIRHSLIAAVKDTYPPHILRQLTVDVQ